MAEYLVPENIKLTEKEIKSPCFGWDYSLVEIDEKTKKPICQVCDVGNKCKEVFEYNQKLKEEKPISKKKMVEEPKIEIKKEEKVEEVKEDKKEREVSSKPRVNSKDRLVWDLVETNTKENEVVDQYMAKAGCGKTRAINDIKRIIKSFLEIYKKEIVLEKGKYKFKNGETKTEEVYSVAKEELPKVEEKLNIEIKEKEIEEVAKENIEIVYKDDPFLKAEIMEIRVKPEEVKKEEPKLKLMLGKQLVTGYMEIDYKLNLNNYVVTETLFDLETGDLYEFTMTRKDFYKDETK